MALYNASSQAYETLDAQLGVTWYLETRKAKLRAINKEFIANAMTEQLKAIMTRVRVKIHKQL